jgi:5-methylcytosine-specific restriction endonuclease McrA
MTDHSLWKPSRAVKDAIDSGNKKASSSQRKRKSRDNDFDNPCANQVYESFLVSVNAPVSEHGMTLIELTSAALKRYFRESPSITGIDPYIPVQRESKGSKEGVPFEATDAFLQSYEWRKLRMEAIKKYGARCQCCGSTPKEGISINVDHIKPRRKHPELALDINNLQILCGPCNHGKGNWDMTDWR